MSRSDSALGTERGSLGVWMASMLAFLASPRLSRKRKKERTEEKARAVEVRASPWWARSASQARNSAGFSLPRASSDVSRRGASAKGTMDEIYLTALNRPPTAIELQEIPRKLQIRVREKDPAAPWQDLLWALINSNEFILNH